VLSHVLLHLIVGLSIVLMLVRPRDIPEVYWIGCGALLLIFLRLVPVRLAGKAVPEGSDVYLFLIGMMLLRNWPENMASSIGSPPLRFEERTGQLCGSSRSFMGSARL
jgi:hypothetical protein